MRKLCLLVALLLCSCQPLPGHLHEHGEAQRIVDQTMAKHPEIVRLTIHAVPTGETKSRIIACNISKKVGQLSDMEDLEAIRVKKTVVLREGNNLDVTAPILDRSGRAIAATGITLLFPKSTTEQALLKKAKSIALELTAAIHRVGRPLW
jgi:hypothetical protein